MTEGGQHYDLPRRDTICNHTLSHAGLLEVEDLSLDPRFSDNSIVACVNGFRFYAGMPLRLSDGSCVGVLCVLGYSPNRLSDVQRRVLGYMANVTVHALEERQKSINAVSEVKRTQLALDRLYNVTPAILQATDGAGSLTRVTDRWLAELGYDRSDVIGRPFSDFVDGAGADLSTPGELRRVRHRDGRLLDMHISSVTGRDAQGTPMGSMTVMENVTSSLATMSALEHSQSFLERTGVVAGVGGWELDLVTQHLTWSDHTYRLHDREPGYEITVEEGLSYYAPSGLPIISEALRRAIEEGQSWDLELPMLSAKGRPFWARVVGVVDFRDGVAIRISGAFQDITNQKLLEQQLAESRQLLEITLDSIGDAVITTNVDADVGWMNPVAERLTGWSRREAGGIPLGVIMPVTDSTTTNPVERAVFRCLKGGMSESVADDAILHGQDRGTFAILTSVAPIRGIESDVLGSVVVFRDMSEQRRQQEEIRNRAIHDPLTGVLNRAGLTAALEMLLQDVQTYPEASHALLYVDLDRFKVINDSCGHSAGDMLLQQITRLLQSTVRSGDIVARLGGDEFCLVLRNCGEHEAVEVAERIRNQVDCHRLFYEGSSFRVGISIGLVPIDGRWTGLAPLLQAGDVSCYAAKEAGRNRVHHWSDTDRTIAERTGATQWVARLERALDDNRFELYGQRIGSLIEPTHGLCCEVLLRMVESDGSLVFPGAFMVAAERFHMAPLLDRWVVREVFKRLNGCPDDADSIRLISINLSGQSLGDRAFRSDICDWIRAARFDVSKLCMEITETSAIARFSEAKCFVDEIRSLGVKVALDDFGAGASSFGYLKNLTVDFLKIDGQFIRNLPNDGLDLVAVQCFRNIAKSVGIRTVAEFVERQEQKDCLAGLDIDLFQGYLFHRPEPLSNLLTGLPADECMLAAE